MNEKEVKKQILFKMRTLSSERKPLKFDAKEKINNESFIEVIKNSKNVESFIENNISRMYKIRFTDQKSYGDSCKFRIDERLSVYVSEETSVDDLTDFLKEIDDRFCISLI